MDDNTTAADVTVVIPPADHAADHAEDLAGGPGVLSFVAARTDGPDGTGVLNTVFLLDVVAAAVSDRSEILTPSAPVLVEAITRPAALVGLTSAGRCAVLLLTAQIHEAWAAESGDPALLVRAAALGVRALAELPGDPPPWTALSAHVLGVRLTGTAAALGHPVPAGTDDLMAVTAGADHDAYLTVVASLVQQLLYRYRVLGRIGDVDAAVAAYRRTIAGDVLRGAARPGDLARVADTLYDVHQESGDPAVLDRLPALLADAERAAAGDPAATEFVLRRLLRHHDRRFEVGRHRDDVIAMIDVLPRLRATGVSGGDWRGTVLRRIAAAASQLFERDGDTDLLSRAIDSLIEERGQDADGAGGSPRVPVDLALLRWRRYGATGDPGELEAAIAVLEELLDGLPRGHEDRAHALGALGLCLRDRYVHDGDRADLDRAIAVQVEALSTADGHGGRNDDFTTAERLSNVGLALWDRSTLTGSLSDLDRAVESIEAAVAMMPADEPLRSTALNNLGAALNDRFRLRHDPADADHAIRVLTDAAAGCLPHSPVRGVILNNLGAALDNKYGLTSDLTVLNRAVDAFEESVTVTPATHPGYPRFLLNLAGGLEVRYDRTLRLADLERAAHLSAEAVDVAPVGWIDRPIGQMRQGMSAAALYEQTGRAADRAAAVTALRAGCRAARLTRPGWVLRAAAVWSGWTFTEGAWEEAAEACDLAVDAMVTLVGLQHRRADKETWLAAARGVPARAGYAHAMTGDLPHAVTALERGRSLQLAEALGRHGRRLDELAADGHADLVARYRRAVAGYAAVLPDSVTAAPGERPPTASPNVLEQAVAPARQERDAAVAAIRAVDPGFLQPATFQDVTAAAREAPLVYLLATEIGGAALIVRGDDRAGERVDVVWLPQLTSRQVWRSFNALRQARRSGDPGAWHGVVDAAAGWLWDAAMAEVLAALDGVPHAVFVATGYLGMLPLHAAWTPDPARPTGRRYALDTLAISYAPSARAVTEAMRVRARGSTGSALVVQDPRPSALEPLPLAQAETDVIRDRFGDENIRVLHRDLATVTEVLGAIDGPGLLHFACHGFADLEEPLDSAVVLAGDDRLTLRTLLGRSGTGRRGIRLAVLSACESQLPGAVLPDEVVSLPTGLLQSGAAGVIATQWTTSGLAAALTMARFYVRWPDPADRPAAAIRDALTWLRDTTNAEKAADLDPRTGTSGAAGRALWRAVLRLPPNERTFAPIGMWATFSHVGV